MASVPEFLAKQLLKQFGLPFHLAPGEAEAECAFLQRRGVVDAVLSEDVDTLMFGSGLTFRNWTPEADVKTKTPTHVNVYDATETKDGAGMDRHGMILVAMMSGGDYVPEGIPGCGPKLACEAARAGFGESLCAIGKTDSNGLYEWKSRLSDELKTNRSKFFKQKHKALIIPEDFPRTDILGYYTDPVVSSGEKVSQLKRTIEWDQEFDIVGLRSFCLDAFDWRCVSGAKHFIRNLSPALLVRSLRMRADEPTPDDTYEVATRESRFVKTIHTRRQHASTDNTNELRIGYRPLDIVPIDLNDEEPDPELSGNGFELDGEAELVAEEAAELGDEPSSPKKRRKTKEYDPDTTVKSWIFETYVKVGVPLKMQDWEESHRNAKKYEAMKALRKQSEQEAKANKARGGMPKGALDTYTRVTKANIRGKKSRSPEIISLAQSKTMSTIDEMEPILANRTKSADTVPSGLQRKDNAFQPQKKGHREESAEPTVVDLLSPPAMSDANVSQRRPLQRSMSDPFAGPEQLEGSKKCHHPTLSLSVAEAAMTVEDNTIRTKKSTLQRSKTLPQEPSQGSLQIDTMLGDEGEGFQLTSNPQRTLFGRKTLVVPPGAECRVQPAFKTPRLLPPTPDKFESEGNQNKFSVGPKHHNASPARGGARFASQSPGNRLKQQDIMMFTTSSQPSSPSRLRTQRKRRASPSYVDNDLHTSHPDRPAASSTQSLGGLSEAERRGPEDPEAVQVINMAQKENIRGGCSSNRAPGQQLASTDTNSRAQTSLNTRGRQKPAVRLRASLYGAFALDDLCENDIEDQGSGNGRRWRVSDVEVVDLTTL